MNNSHPQRVSYTLLVKSIEDTIQICEAMLKHNEAVDRLLKSDLMQGYSAGIRSAYTSIMSDLTNIIESHKKLKQNIHVDQVLL